jgi:hypothetical protein
MVLDEEKCSKIAHNVLEDFAGVCNNIIRDSKIDDPEFADVTSSILAGAVQFSVKSLIMAGFTRDDVIKTVSNCYDAVQNDTDIVRAKMLRALLGSMGEIKIQ